MVLISVPVLSLELYEILQPSDSRTSIFIVSEKMKFPMIKMTNLSSEKSSSSLLVVLELSTNTVLNIAYFGLLLYLARCP